MLSISLSHFVKPSSGLGIRKCTCEICTGSCVHELLLSGFSHNAVCGLQGQDGSVDGDRVSNLNG